MSSAIDLDVWALTATCPSVPSALACQVNVDQSIDGGASWQPVGAVATSSRIPDTNPAGQFELARITTERAYVLSDLGDADQPAWYLEFTDNGGVTWVTRPAPCVGTYADGAEVAASSTMDLWLLCGGTPTTGVQFKQLYRSSDGGATWRLAASTSLGPPSAQPGDPLPVGGYVAPLAPGHHTLAVASATTAWLYPERAGLFKTSDGGASWVPVADLANAGFPNGGQGNVTFLSETQGWICAYGIGLWHTEDGTHWEPLGAS